MQVDSASSSQSFFEGPGSMAGQVDKRWIRSKKSAEKANAARAAPPPKLTPEDTAMGAPVRDAVPAALSPAGRRPLPCRPASRLSPHRYPAVQVPTSPQACGPLLTSLQAPQPQP